MKSPLTTAILLVALVAAVTAYVPDPKEAGGSSAAEGVAVDREGNVYGAEVGPRDLKKYATN